MQEKIITRLRCASLPRQFDEYIRIDGTRTVTPLGPEVTQGMPATFPFGV
ncbi:MAG: hypothetical protein ACMUIA_01010 [bacterium]